MAGKNNTRGLVRKLRVDSSVAIERELIWLEEVIALRFSVAYDEEVPFSSIYDIPPPNLEGDPSFYAKFIVEHDLGFSERLAVVLTLAPHIKPAMLDPLFVKNPDTERYFTEFGGIKSSRHNGFLPTGQTLVYLLDENSEISRKFEVFQFFEEDHFFARFDILRLSTTDPEEPRMTGVMLPGPDFLDSVIHGKPRIPRFGTEFPAKIIETKLEWEDLVLTQPVYNQLEEIHTWLKHNKTLANEWGMGRKIKPGYRSLFYGPPGTGKTLTAALLGRQTGKPVFRIDLSMVVSKYIGETEKNLARVFNAAENKDWILFFDEADALFGKRTKVNDSHDRYANQEVSYLLQRVEEFAGLVILATNLKSNLDDAFTRRFQTIVHFPMPTPEERLRLWELGFSDKAEMESSINMRQISAKYELSGGAIINVIQYCSLMALKKGGNVIYKKDLLNGIKREFSKEGRTI